MLKLSGFESSVQECTCIQLRYAIHIWRPWPLVGSCYQVLVRKQFWSLPVASFFPGCEGQRCSAST